MPSPRQKFSLPFRLGAASLWVAAALCAGCGNTTSSTRPGGGDTGGSHLVVFASDRGQTAGQFDLYLYDLDFLGFRVIRGISSATASDLHPSISSDGLVIAFQSNRGTGSDILLYSRALQQLIALPGVNSTADETEPAFTGDAIRMAFTQSVGAARRVRMVDGVGDTLLHLAGLDTTATFSDWAPSPNQTGSRIAFVTDRNGNPDIFVWDAATRTLLNLPNLNSAGNDVDPSLTPDGHYLCFASDRAGGAGGYDLYLYDLLINNFVPLPANTNSTTNERHPAISISGDVIVFESDRTGGLGKIDLWNCRRSTSTVGQAPQESSTGDDVGPALLYP